MIQNHVAMVRFGVPKDSEESPFDEKKCCACGEAFGLLLGQVSRAPQYPDICQKCYADVMALTPESAI